MNQLKTSKHLVDSLLEAAAKVSKLKGHIASEGFDVGVGPSFTLMGEALASLEADVRLVRDIWALSRNGESMHSLLADAKRGDV